MADLLFELSAASNKSPLEQKMDLIKPYPLYDWKSLIRDLKAVSQVENVLHVEDYMKTFKPKYKEYWLVNKDFRKESIVLD